MTVGKIQKARGGAVGINIPCIDMSQKVVNRGKLSETMVKACEEFGFFVLKNHGVPKHKVSRLETEIIYFFQKPAREKQRAGPPKPFGYGCKYIGSNGDQGELEYLLLEADPVSINQRSTRISHRPQQFSCAVTEYLVSVREEACEILDLVEEGLGALPGGLNPLEDHHPRPAPVFSKFIRDANSDSCLRINYYPPADDPAAVNDDDNIVKDENWDAPAANSASSSRVGFGEHSDPQILTILRSNDVPGLQICSPDGHWIPVSPDLDHFCVFVGDAFQALTNGRFKSVRHRVVVSSGQPRISTMYFGAPALNALISPLPRLVSTHNPSLYRAFTWGEFKKVVYSSPLADHRLRLFKNELPPAYPQNPTYPYELFN